MSAFTGLGREIHRTWFLTWRIPVAAWHGRRADRLRELARLHEDQALAISKRALDLNDRYPSKVTKSA